MKTQLLAAVLTASVVTAAHAAIVVNNTDSTTGLTSGSTTLPGSLTLSGFDLSGGTKLVVTTGSEAGPGGSMAYSLTSITFAGQALTPIFQQIADGSAQIVTAYYIDNPIASSGDIIATFSRDATLGIGAISISGAELGFADFSSSGSGANSGSYDVLAGDLIVGSFAANASNTAIDPNNSSTDIFSATNITTSGGTNAAAAYYFAASSGTDSFGFTGGGTRPVAGAAVFTVVPEPGSLALLGLGGLLIAARRRRNA